jgi:hypothetical protein
MSKAVRCHSGLQELRPWCRGQPPSVRAEIGGVDGAIVG